MNQTNKQIFILLAIAFVLVLIVGFFAVFLFFRNDSSTNQQITFPTPTPVAYTRDENGQFIFTSLQRTVIDKTSTENIESRSDILNRSQDGTITTFELRSATPGEIDEIKTENGIVTFESTNIFNKQTGSYPPKVAVYEREFGEPEKIIEGVSNLGLHISAHIYASDGFTLFVNRATNTVYVIQRFSKMSTEEYEEKYSEYLQPAPDYPQESFEE